MKVICIDNSGIARPYLTENKEYHVVETLANGHFYIIKDDRYNSWPYRADRFKKVEENNETKISIS